MEDDVVTPGTVGTPQGAVISPLLANIYLHYVFDLWANQWRKRHAHGDIIIVRGACPCEGASTSRRKFEPLWGLCQATRGLPFTVQRNGFAIVALK
jgi:hypothetical protein